MRTAGQPDRDKRWWSGGSGSDAQVIHGGHAPEDTLTVRLTFGDHERVTTPVNSDGYFLVVLNERVLRVELPDLLEAFDADGNIIASTNRPMG